MVVDIKLRRDKVMFDPFTSKYKICSKNLNPVDLYRIFFIEEYEYVILEKWLFTRKQMRPLSLCFTVEKPFQETAVRHMSLGEVNKMHHNKVSEQYNRKHQPIDYQDSLSFTLNKNNVIANECSLLVLELDRSICVQWCNELILSKMSKYFQIEVDEKKLTNILYLTDVIVQASQPNNLGPEVFINEHMELITERTPLPELPEPSRFGENFSLEDELNHINHIKKEEKKETTARG